MADGSWAALMVGQVASMARAKPDMTWMRTVLTLHASRAGEV